MHTDNPLTRLTATIIAADNPPQALWWMNDIRLSDSSRDDIISRINSVLDLLSPGFTVDILLTIRSN